MTIIENAKPKKAVIVSGEKNEKRHTTVIRLSRKG